MTRLSARGALALACALVGRPVLADVRLLGEARLAQSLERQAQCCVIDARGPRQRQAHPVADALPYRPGMKIVPTATVVVIADGDDEAMRIARAIEKSHPGKDIVAVQGGAATWSAIVLGRQAAGAPQGGLRFVIPRNTCESGTPLQSLIRKSP